MKFFAAIGLCNMFITGTAFGDQQGPVMGGNMPALRPAYTEIDAKNFDLGLSYLKPGDIARVSPIEWEVLWDPKGQYNYRGVDIAIQKLASKGIKPLWLLQPCPYPKSPWYASGWNDWWLPQREIWPDVIRMNTRIANHIIEETKKYSNEMPFFQIWNEPEGGKPGGSTTSKFGEWTPEIHELLYKIVKDLRSNHIPKDHLVGPAISSFGESRRSETAEYLSVIPPKEFDWLSECGFRDVHVRFSAPGAKGDPVKVKVGFEASLAWFSWVDSRLAWPKDQKVMLSEYYVTPGDVGVPIGSDMYPFHAIAFDVLKETPFVYAIAWGMRPGESDVAGNPWATFGGLGDSLVKWRGGS